ncbi:MAG: YkgJ family cysteine cluster protein [Thermodesulfobacteriota bacterium]
MTCNTEEPAPGSGEQPIFTCRQCGDCCKGYGGTYLTSADIAAISRFIGVEPGPFLETYCTFSGSKPVLSQRADGYCIFWDRLCTIHPVKPFMCRAWPYIRSVLIDPDNWYAMAGSCPGMRTDVSTDRIREVVQAQWDRLIAGKQG